MKKFISLMLSLSVVASAMTFVQTNISAATIPTPKETTLFSDNFEGYAEGIPSNIGNWSQPTVEDVSGTTDFKVYSHDKLNASKPECYTEANISKIAQIETAENSGIGSGSSLMITAQSGAQQHQLIKASGITEDEANKTLVFVTKFKVPNFVGYCDGVGVYLAASANNKYVSDITTDSLLHRWPQESRFPGELIYLGSRPSLANSTVWWNPRHDVATNHNQLWTFGEKIATLTKDTEYTYTITMTPDGNGGYSVITNLNGEVKELGLEATPNRSAIPTVEEMATFTAVRIARLSNPYSFMTEHAKTDQATVLTEWLTTGHGSTLGITTSDGLYNNDRVVAYFDDMSLKSVAPSGVVFSDDFEGYSTGIIKGYRNWWNKGVANYEYDTFRWMNGGQPMDYSTHELIGAWIKEALTKDDNGNTLTGPEANDVAVIEENAGAGSGKALKFTGQPGIENYSMAKKSNLDTADIAGKQLVFGADFKAPISGVMGEGFGVWVATDVENGAAIRYISTDTEIANGTDEVIKGEFMYVGSRKNVHDGKMATSGARATYLYVFGEEVARLNPDAVYDVKVTLTPTTEGGYTGAVALNGRNIALKGTNLPTQAEMATYNRLYANPINRVWTMQEGGGGMWSNTAYPADMVNPETGYIFGRTIGVLDNIYLCAQETEAVAAADAAVNMAAINTGWESKATSFVSALATVSGTTATVEVRSDKTTAITPVIMAAAYDENGTLMNVVMDDKTTVAPFGKEVATLSGLAEGYTTVKVFVWDMADINAYTVSKGFVNSALGDDL